MALRKKLALVMSLFMMASILAGCQPAKNQRQSIRVGRARADVSGNRSAFDAYGTKGTESNKTWGEVTSNASSQSWMQELLNFSAPSLNGVPADQALGFVSGSSGQNTGVRFYGNAVTNGSSGGYSRSFDPKSMTIHIEIYDDKTANGTAAPVVIEISPAIDGYVATSGSLSGSQVNLNFQDAYGMVRMQGTINGNSFTGQFGYCTGDQSYCSNTGNTRLLGNFAVDTCGFFQCN